MALKMVSKTMFRLLSVVLILALVTACSSGNGGSASNGQDQNEGQKTISIGTPPVGASYNAVGSGLAKVISNNSSVRVTVKPSQGPSAWGPQLNKGEIQLGVASGPDLAWAFKGVKGYKKPMKNMRLLVRGNYLTATGIAVRKDSDINSVADLKGKKVATYPGAAIGEMGVEATLVANGLTWDDVQKVPTPSLFEGMKALQDRRVDAAFAMTPKTPVSQQVHNQVGLRGPDLLDDYSAEDIDDVPQEIIDKLTSRIPGVKLTVAQPAGYLKEKTLGIKYPAEMVTSTHLSEDKAYEIMETLWNNYKKLHPVHVWLKSWTPEQMFDPNPTIPYHPGAVKFFKDKGLWNDKVDKIQKSLLEAAGSAS